MADEDATLTRADLRSAACRACPAVSREDARDVVEAILEEISTALARGETVKLSGFGVFKVKSKPERMGRNPRTGVEAAIAPRRIITFKASPVLKEFIAREGMKPEKSGRSEKVVADPVNGESNE